MTRRFLRTSTSLSIAALCITAIAAPPAGAWPWWTPVITQLELPVAGTTTTVFDDTIQWSGSVRLIIAVWPESPFSPQDPVRVLTYARDLVGEGSSGRVYRAVGVDAFTSDTLDLAFTESYLVLARANPGDPYLPPSPILPIQFVVALDPFGDVGFSSATIVDHD